MILINHLNTYINKGVIEAIDDNQRMLLRKHIPANPTKGNHGGILIAIVQGLDKLGGPGPHGNDDLEDNNSLVRLGITITIKNSAIQRSNFDLHQV